MGAANIFHASYAARRACATGTTYALREEQSGLTRHDRSTSISYYKSIKQETRAFAPYDATSTHKPLVRFSLQVALSLADQVCNVDEVIRQIVISCQERGLLLLRIRDEMNLTINAYRALYESSVAFGMRKALGAEGAKDEATDEVIFLGSTEVQVTQPTR